jgi:hypothetical protein
MEWAKPAPAETDTRTEEEEAPLAQEAADLGEGPLSVLEEMERLESQHTPPYAFENPFQYILDDSPQAADGPSPASGELPSKRGVWFWLRWVFIGWGLAVFFVLLFLAVFVGR